MMQKRARILRTHLTVGENFFFLLIGFDENFGSSYWLKGTISDNYRKFHIYYQRKKKCVSFDDLSYMYFGVTCLRHREDGWDKLFASLLQRYE